MTEKELADCKATAVALNGISFQGLLLFITLPTVLFTEKPKLFWEREFILVFIISGLLLAFRAWHLQFDAKLINNLANKNLEIDDIDTMVFRLFKKKVQSTVAERIDACYKLAKGFEILMAIHLLLFFALLLWKFLC